MIIKITSVCLLIWGLGVFIIDLRRSQKLMIKGKSLNSLYLFNRNIVHYLGRQLLAFKHVDCLPEEVEKNASTLEQMAPSCITQSS